MAYRLSISETRFSTYKAGRATTCHQPRDSIRLRSSLGAPTASVVSAHAADRDDVVRPSLDRAEALANAPDAARQAGLFRVPRVIG